MIREGMRRRDFMKTAGAVLGGAALSRAAYGAEAKPPNVLFIAIEDIAALGGCFGSPQVKTPNFDALAKRGVVFQNAYCQVALCNPSRASVITGLRPQTLDVFGNETDWRARIPEGHPTLPEFFQARGYETVTCGKITHHADAFKDRSAEGNARQERMWDTHLKTKSKGYQTKPRRPAGELPEGISEDEYVVRSLEWGPTGLEPEEQYDGAIAIAASEALKKDRDKPFFMAIGFHAPHYVLRAPDKFHAMYPPESITLPDYPEDDLEDVPYKYPNFNTLDTRRLTDAETREVLSSYYATVSYVDWCIGEMMKALEESGRAKDTVVCLWGDHGMQLGEHGLWRKMTLFEEADRVPLIVAGPGVEAEGASCTRMVELIDMYPTLVDLCGFDVPARLEGTSMKPLLKDPTRPWKKAAFTSRAGGGRSLRTKRWRYTEWRTPDKAELYDHANDPREINNLANSPVHVTTVARLSRLLNAGWKAALPQDN